MHVGILGINHKSAKLQLREKLAKGSLSCLGNESSLSERLGCVVLSTCNRTEIYFSSEDMPKAHSELLAHLRQEIDQPFEHHLYSYFEEECFNHLALVTAGLDSAIVGETEIQGQVKQAYQNASCYRTLPYPIHFMFQKCLKIGKEVRSFYPLQGQPSLEKILFSFSQSFFHQKEYKVLFVGNSEINRKVLFFFRKKGISDLTLCTRSPQFAEGFAAEYEVELISWQKLHLWPSYDLVICATHQQEYLLFPQQLQKEDPSKVRLVIDLSVPRTVDPLLASHPQMRLVNIEELSLLIDKSQSQNVPQLETVIRESATKYWTLFLSKNVFRKSQLCPL